MSKREMPPQPVYSRRLKQNRFRAPVPMSSTAIPAGIHRLVLPATDPPEEMEVHHIAAVSMCTSTSNAHRPSVNRGTSKEIDHA
jgi:hypothetical protein